MKRSELGFKVVQSIVVVALAGCNRNAGGAAASSATEHPQTAQTASTATPSAAGGTPAAANATPLVASANDPRDTALGAFVRDVSQAIVHAAKGEPVDPRWVSPHPVHTASAVTATDRPALTLLGNTLTVLASEIEIDALAQPGPGEHHQVMTHAILLPDGTLHWGTASSRQEESELAQPTPALEVQAAAVTPAIVRATDGLRGSCSLPWLTDAEVQPLPVSVRRELLPDAVATHAACTQVAGVHGEWRPHIDDVRVFVQGNGHVGILSSSFNVEGADSDASMRLVLGAVHAEVVHEGT